SADRQRLRTAAPASPTPRDESSLEIPLRKYDHRSQKYEGDVGEAVYRRETDVAKRDRLGVYHLKLHVERGEIRDHVVDAPRERGRQRRRDCRAVVAQVLVEVANHPDGRREHRREK